MMVKLYTAGNPVSRQLLLMSRSRCRFGISFWEGRSICGPEVHRSFEFSLIVCVFCFGTESALYRWMRLDSELTSRKKLTFALSIFELATALTGCAAALTGGRSAPVSTSLSVTPTSVSVGVSQSQQFSVSVQNDAQSRGVNWVLMQSGVACTPQCGALSSTE